MARRYSYNRRSHFTNEAQMYLPTVTFRHQVVPGQTANLNSRIYMRSQQFDQALVVGGLLTNYFFYVPYRLLWDEFANFIADGTITGSAPSTTTAWARLFDVQRSAGTKEFNALDRRAYKLVYNQFFGSEELGKWYTDVTADSTTTEFGAKNTDQFLGRGLLESDLEDPTYTNSGTGTDTVINLEDFSRAQRDFRSQRRRDMTGDKYVDQLRLMGVDLDWRVQMAPEFLGAKTQEVLPRVQEGELQTTTPYARFQATLEHSCSKKRFAEHGVVLGITLFRPHVFRSQAPGTYDGFWQDHENWFLGSNDRDVDEWDRADIGGAAAADAMVIPRFHHLRTGGNFWGKVDNQRWIPSISSTDLDQVIYVSPFNLTATAGSPSGDNLSFYNATVMAGQTPVAPGRV